jgi:hypothetical protein
LEEIKVAEQLVKKKNQQQLHQATQQLGNSEQVRCVKLLFASCWYDETDFVCGFVTVNVIQVG